MGSTTSRNLKVDGIANMAGTTIWRTDAAAAYNSSAVLLLDLTGSRVNLSQGFAFLNPSLSSAVTMTASTSGSNHAVVWPINNAAGFMYNNGSGTMSWVTTKPTVQRFTSGTAATYTTPAGVWCIKVTCVGGGGGGAGSGTASSSSNGTAGNASSFGTALITANGGSAGSFGGAGAAGGSGTVSAPGVKIFEHTGGSGAGGIYLASSGAAVVGGQGGVNILGGAGATDYNGAGSAAATNTGAGGSGGGVNATVNAFSGPGGGAGGVAVAFIAAPSATYTYTVGGSAAGGSAGTSGSAGGAGAAGLIIVEEFYV